MSSPHQLPHGSVSVVSASCLSACLYVGGAHHPSGGVLPDHDPHCRPLCHSAQLRRRCRLSACEPGHRTPRTYYVSNMLERICARAASLLSCVAQVFDASYRPVPLEQLFIGVSDPNSVRRLKLMDRICHDRVVRSLREKQQCMVFVHSRKGTVTTAEALLELARELNTISLFECTYNSCCRGCCRTLNPHTPACSLRARPVRAGQGRAGAVFEPRAASAGAARYRHPQRRHDEARPTPGREVLHQGRPEGSSSAAAVAVAVAAPA